MSAPERPDCRVAVPQVAAGAVAPPRLLVAGMPRSGTTWAASALGAALVCRQRMEPFRPEAGADGFAAAAWRFRDGGDADSRFDRIIEDAFGSVPVVVKDVHGILALARTCALVDPAVLVTVRNPLAVAASWQRVGWLEQDRAGAILRTLLDQPSLLDAHLGPYARALRPSGDPLRDVGALWGAVHRVLTDQRRRFPRWVFVHHEELCADPYDRFRSALAAAGVPLGPRGAMLLAAFVEAYDDEPRSGEGPFAIVRRTAAEPARAAARLAPHAARQVLAAVEPFGLDDLVSRDR